MGTDAFGRSGGDTATTPAVPGTARGPVTVPGWLVALLLAVLSLGGTALVLVRAERDKLDDPLQQVLRGEVVNLHEVSLLRADRARRAFAAAVAGMRPDEVVTSLVLAPAGLTLNTRDDGAFQRVHTVDVAFGVERSQSGRVEIPGLRPGDVRLDGVEALTRAVLDRIPERSARVDRVTLGRILLPERGTAVQSEWRIDVDEVRPSDSTWFARVDGAVVRRADEPVELTAARVP